MEEAILGAGCFWCVDAIFRQLKGVQKVESGYAGGEVYSPSYEDISKGDTGHAEVIRIIYEPARISYETLLEVFWHVHNPTTLNRQGNDVGTQYRSVIFYQTEEEKTRAIASKVLVSKSNLWEDPIVTEISPLKNYFPAEDYHQNYFNEKGQVNGYCSLVIAPKVAKFKQKFKHLLA